jgi:PKD repeat protein
MPTTTKTILRVCLGIAALCIAACGSDEDPPANGRKANATGGMSGSGGTPATGGTQPTGGRQNGGTSGSTSGTGGNIIDVRDPLPCFADEGTPAGSALNLVLAPSRVRGVAPLSIYFDTLGTTSDATERTFHDIAYCWDFGDMNAGSFATTGLSKNQAKGPIAAHVFETPGTYTVTVSARDVEGRVSSRAVEINVEDPEQVFAGQATVCFSDSGDFSGCPAGAQQQSAGGLQDLADHISTGRRLLLHRGETYSGGSIQINVPGPGMIGAYGDGERPIITGSGSFYISDQVPVFSDWRISDLDLTSEGGSESGLVWFQGKGDHLLLLRVRGVGYANGIVGSTDVIEYLIEQGFDDQDVFDTMMVADCELREVAPGEGNNLMFIAGHRVMIMGTTMQDSTQGEHVLRAPWLDRAVLSNNELGGAPEPRHVLKLNAPIFNQGTLTRGRYTEYVVISDNIFHGDGGHVWTIAISPENGDFDERVRDVIVERNLLTPGPDVTLGIEVSGQNITIRDNIFNRGTGSGCVDVDQLGIEPIATGIVLLNNTCYSSRQSSLITFNEGEAEASVYNNLLVTTGGERAVEGGGQVTEGGNIVTTAPGFANAAPEAWEDFALGSGSQAIDSGDSTLFSAWDYAGRPRPVDGNGDSTAVPDVGALELDP